jgi:hypothetical protein
MPHWILKAATQGAISRLPWKYSIHRLIQCHVTKSLILTPQLFEEQLRLCRTHLENFRSARSSDETPGRVLELGTGWHPTTPVGFYLCGTGAVWTIDKVQLLQARSVLPVLELFVEYARTGKLARFLPTASNARVGAVEEVLHSGRHSSPVAILEQINVHALVIDASDPTLDVGPIDLFVSNNTLEHIPADAIRRIFARFGALASEEAVMSHFVDLSDHYSYFDHSIPSLNFLKYPDRYWRFCSNDLLYQNRLRMPDYRGLHESAGFRILFESNTRDSRAFTKSARLAGKFRCMPAEDLEVTKSWIVSGLGRSGPVDERRPDF